MGALTGDIVVLGAGGKMGPTLVRLAARAMTAAGATNKVIAVARFSEPGLRGALEADGVVTVAADLVDPVQLAALPSAANVVFMVGQKFGTTGDESRTWGLNAWLPGAVAQRYRDARIVAFSTGNVYPLWPADSEGPAESDPVGPIGEYAQSTLARERVLEFFSRRNGTPMTILRLNYAIEPRYGVLRDLADAILEQRPIDLTMGHVNVIGQRDANAVALRCFHHCASPPFVLNLTGRPAVATRDLAEALGRRLGIEPRFRGSAGPTALLSNAKLMEQTFGRPETSLDEMIDQVASWVEQGGRSLGKPTHYEVREGRF
jgi:nucleoside-diphosphate-sugar epimerase